MLGAFWIVYAKFVLPWILQILFHFRQVCNFSYFIEYCVYRLPIQYPQLPCEVIMLVLWGLGELHCLLEKELLHWASGSLSLGS